MTPARILIVEDDRVVARDIGEQLRRIGHDVLGSSSRGEDAVSLAIETQPDLVLMDIRLEGDVDGIDAAQQIRARCRSPVVFLTAYADDETVERASKAEPFGYLLKPFDETQLRTVIEMALFKHAAERRLRESERRFAATLASIGDAVIATDDAGTVTFMNPMAVSLTGWSHADAIGRPITDVFNIVNEETLAQVEGPAGKAMRLGITVGLANHTCLISRDGRMVPIDDCGSPIIDDDGQTTGAVLVFRDISQRRMAAESLREAEQALARVGRLTTVGELTVSISHEINQPLMAIVTDAAACLGWLGHEHLNLTEARLAAQRIVRDGHRAGEVVANIRALARKTPPRMGRLDLNAAILDVLVLMRGELRKWGVPAETELAADLDPAFGDPVQTQQVVLNLIMNAIEAIAAADGPNPLLRIASRHGEPGFIEVSIADTGVGLDPVIAERVFEPFFTTKPDGLGMGLAICRTILETHGGKLWATPNAPCGTIFRFCLPTFAAEVEGGVADRRPVR